MDCLKRTKHLYLCYEYFLCVWNGAKFDSQSLPYNMFCLCSELKLKICPLFYLCLISLHWSRCWRASNAYLKQKCLNNKRLYSFINSYKVVKKQLVALHTTNDLITITLFLPFYNFQLQSFTWLRFYNIYQDWNVCYHYK